MRKILFVLLLGFSPLVILGQLKATAENGKKVVLFDDGTWRYEKTDIINLGSCNELIEENYDRVSGETTISAATPFSFKSDGQGGRNITILLYRQKKSVQMILFLGDNTCIYPEDKVNILFRDGTRIKIRNEYRFNCDGSWGSYFGRDNLGKLLLKYLSTKEVDVLRAHIKGYPVECTFTQEQSEKFKKTIKCLKDYKFRKKKK